MNLFLPYSWHHRQTRLILSDRRINFLAKSLVCFIILWISTLAFCGLNAQDTVLVDDNFISSDIGSQVFHNEESVELRFDKEAKSWHRLPHRSVGLNQNKVHILHTVIYNGGARDRSLKLLLNNARIGKAVLYIQDDNGADSMSVTGSTISKELRASRDRLLSFPLQLRAKQTVSLYIKAWTTDLKITVTPLLVDPARTDLFHWSDYLIGMVLTGILLIIVAGIIVLYYFRLWETTYFLAFSFFGFWYLMAASGFGSIYLWSASPWIEQNAVIFFAAASTCCFIELSRRLMDAPRYYPVFNKFLIILMLAYLGLTITGFWLSYFQLAMGLYSMLLNIPYALIIITYLIILEISFYNSFIKKQSEFWLYAAVLFVYIGCYVVRVLLRTGYIPYSGTSHSMLLVSNALPLITFMPLFMARHLFRFSRRTEPGSSTNLNNNFKHAHEAKFKSVI
jgi:hypothetical protein